MPRPYDIILFGATGFTGKLVSQYLYEHSREENIRIALAGRDRQKLEKVRDSLPEAEGFEKPGLIIANIKDPTSLADMASKGVILMTTVGPFNIYGREVVKAAVEAGTHYLDITGEPLFVEFCRHKLHEKAIARSVCIINCCGFDSIPADLGTWLTVRELPSDQPAIVRSFYKTNAKFSGGTWTTAIMSIHNQQNKGSDRSSRQKSPKHPDKPKISRSVHKSDLTGRWAIPMPVVDHHIVRQTAQAMPEDFGKAFAYAQFFSLRTFWQVLKLVVPLAFIFPLARFRITRDWLLSRIKPGEGPDETTRAKSFFEVQFFGEADNKQVKYFFAGRDPGYNETAKMFSQAAFTLLEKTKNGTLKTGVLTPAVALGMPLVDRLRKEDITIEQL